MPGDAGPLPAELAVVFRRAMASYALFQQALADHLGLHPTDVQCLNQLTLEDGPVTTGRIAELTGLTTGSATRLVDRLERAGHVVRERSAGDRRLVLVAPVPEKAAEFARVWEQVGGGWVGLVADLDDAELASFIDHMGRAADFAAGQAGRLLRSGDA